MTTNDKTMIRCVICVLLVCCVSNGDAAGHSSRRTIAPIGGLFNYETLPGSLEVFKNIAPENDKQSYIGRSLATKAMDTYSTSLEICDFTSDVRGIVALVDVRPTNGICDIVCLLCNKYNIAHLSIGWEPIEDVEENIFTFSYHPPIDVISKAYTELTKHLGFDKFTIFYEDDSAFLRLEDLINSWANIKEPITFSKLDPDGDNRETFKNTLKIEHINFHIIDCAIENTYKYFNEITEVEEATQYNSIILSNLDAYTLDLSEIPQFKANVSVLHLATLQTEDRWNDIGMSLNSMRLETALTADALYHLERAVKSLFGEGNAHRKPPTPPALCYQSTEADYEPLAWPLGNKLREALVEHKASGFTGNVEFDENGRRINFEMHYSKMDKYSKFVHVGTWDSKTNKLEGNDRDVTTKASDIDTDSVIKIVTKIGEPFVREKPTSEGTELEGYAVDLVEKIFEVIKKEKKLDLQYDLKKVYNGKTGSKIKGTKKWDGMIGELMEHRADMAVADLTITSDRNAVVDFSVPFMTLGIGMMMRERDEVPPEMFSFLKPLTLEVWLILAAVFMIVSFIVLICARMSQDDWVNPHPCNQNPENLQNIWSYYNCMWLCIGAIMCQGCDIMPRAVGTRWISGMWWFFALIITSSYTANMSTFLSEGRRNDNIKDVKSLAEQTKVSYGTTTNSSTFAFFEKSNDTTYHKLYEAMISAKPTVFAEDNERGKERVLSSKGNYAIFMESTQIEFYTNKFCVLKKVGSELDSKEYGIAFPKGSMFKTYVDYAILYLQENGTLHNLKQKWWVEMNPKSEEYECEDAAAKQKDNGALKMKNTSGIFLVLGTGGLVGLLVAVVDFLLNAEDISVKEKVSFKEAIISEWCASMDPKQLHRLAAPPRSAPPSSGSPSPSRRERSQSRAISVIRAASSFINFDEIY